MRATFYATVGSTALRALNYAPEVEAFKRAGARRRSVALGSLSDDFGAAYRRIFTRQECDPGNGVELLGQSDMFAMEPVGRWIRADGIRGIEDQRIKPGQLLFAGVGTLGETELYGRCILADKRLEGRIIGSDAVALTFKEPDSDVAAFAYAFLCTRAGLRSVRATGYGTKLMSLRMDFLRALPIPLGTDEQMARVGVLIRTTVEQREAYARHIREARSLLEKIPGFIDARAMCEKRKARFTWWDQPLLTLSAWNHAGAGEALKFLQQSWSRKLSDALRNEGVFNGPRFARVPCEAPHGIPFLSQRDVFMVRPSGRRIAHPGVPDRLLQVSEGDLLAGSHGQFGGDGDLFGRIEYATCSLSTCSFTQDLLRIQLEDKDRSLAFAYLSSSLGLRMMRTTAVGTSIPSMRLGLVRALPFPSPTPTVGAAIHTAVTAAIEARESADAAESEAIRIVEQEVLPAWLA